MNSNNKDNDNEKNNNNSFDIFRNENELNNFFDVLERMVEKTFSDINYEDFPPGRSFVHGFNVHIGSDGKPRIQEFGNFPEKSSNGETRISEEREPLIDIIENDEKVAVTVEIPGVEKEDINLNVKDQILEILVNHPNRKYQKTVDLPCVVKAKTTNATYKNGVLDIEIEKKKKGYNKGGFKVKID